MTQDYIDRAGNKLNICYINQKDMYCMKSSLILKHQEDADCRLHFD